MTNENNSFLRLSNSIKVKLGWQATVAHCKNNVYYFKDASNLSLYFEKKGYIVIQYNADFMQICH